MKDVSCKVFRILFKAIKKDNLDTKIIFQDIPYNLDYLKNASENIEWDVFCKIMLNLREMWNDDDYINAGKEIARNPALNILSAVSRFFLNVKAIYRIVNTPKRGVGHQYFRCITPSFEEIDENHLRVTLTLPQSYQYCSEFFLLTKGFFISVPQLLKQTESKVDMYKIDGGAFYDIFITQNPTALSRVRKLFAKSSSVKASAKELTEAYELLYERYNQLELSRAQIEKQTKQIEAAFNISRLIKTKLDLNFALNNIGKVLIADSSFAAVQINVDTVIDGEGVKDFAELGSKPHDVTPIQKRIEAFGIEVGDIILWPQTDSHIGEVQELLDYIVPTISMEIINAVAFKLLDDYSTKLELIIDKRTKQLNNANQELASTIEQLKELQTAKDRFFSGISHEFRTPLTLILGPVDKLLMESGDELVKKQANTIKQNAIRLLGLINQLLELSKLEAGKVKLNSRKGNIVSFVHGIVLLFESLADQKKINLIINSEKENIPLYFNKDMMMKIISNLVSNSLKFTNEGGEIRVNISEKESNDDSKIVEIIVWDNGIGVLEKELPKLFDNYFQVDQSYSTHIQGTGIGLALTKELVEIHHGKINVQSKTGNVKSGVRGWTEFNLEFLAGKDHLQKDEILDEESLQDLDSVDETKIYEDINFFKADFSLHNKNRNDIEHLSDEISARTDEDSLVVLVVEDNHDVREFIKDCLSTEFQIELAADGKDAEIKAEKIIPDLIISDVMMPNMNGYELTRILKNNEKTSHIPIILLTAKSQQESKIEGLEAGADDFLTKPFDASELRIRINNLINIRRKLQEKYKKEDYIFVNKSHTKKLSNIEEKFMCRVLDVIEKNVADEDFSIEQFGKEIGMSRVQLHRKLKALTGKSASSYLRSVRLLKAKKMLEEKEGNISEIAYSTGFSSPTYFTRCFKEEFGYLPSNLKN